MERDGPSASRRSRDWSLDVLEDATLEGRVAGDLKFSGGCAADHDLAGGSHLRRGKFHQFFGHLSTQESNEVQTQGPPGSPVPFGRGVKDLRTRRPITMSSSQLHGHFLDGTFIPHPGLAHTRDFFLIAMVDLIASPIEVVLQEQHGWGRQIGGQQVN